MAGPYASDRAEAAVICAPYRRTLVTTDVFNPFGVLQPGIAGPFEPAVSGSDGDGQGRVGSIWDEASGLEKPEIGPEAQMPGSKSFVVVGRNHIGKGCGIPVFVEKRL